MITENVSKMQVSRSCGLVPMEFCACLHVICFRRPQDMILKMSYLFRCILELIFAVILLLFNNGIRLPFFAKSNARTLHSIPQSKKYLKIVLVIDSFFFLVILMFL